MVGIPLKNWSIQINYGIKTGFNEAFIINTEIRNEIIKKCPKAAEIIRPILRGRDIRKYQVQWDGVYLIAIHNGYTNSLGKYIEPVKIDSYPAVKEYLDNYWEKIEKRLDKGFTPYNLRSCIYMEDFFRPKIIYPEITKFINFYLDAEENYFVNNKCFILSGEYIEYLIAFLNSSVFKFCFINDFPDLIGGTRELRKIFLEKVPIKKITTSQNKLFANKVYQIQKLKKEGIDTTSLEMEVDNMIFDLYELTKKEREIIGFIKII